MARQLRWLLICLGAALVSTALVPDEAAAARGRGFGGFGSRNVYRGNAMYVRNGTVSRGSGVEYFLAGPRFRNGGLPYR